MTVRRGYAIVCPRCAALGLEKTVHVMRSPKARWCRKHATAEAQKKYRAMFPEKRALYQKRDYERHAEARRAWAREAYHRNRAQRLERQREYNVENRDARCRYLARYRRKSHVKPGDERIAREIRNLALV